MKTTKKDIKVMYKILLTPTFISIVAFGLLSLASYLLTKESEHNYRIGFPYKFYEQFRLSRSDSNNWGWHPTNLLFDIIIIWTLSVAGYFFWIRKFYKPKDIEKHNS